MFDYYEGNLGVLVEACFGEPCVSGTYRAQSLTKDVLSDCELVVTVQVRYRWHVNNVVIWDIGRVSYCYVSCVILIEGVFFQKVVAYK